MEAAQTLLRHGAEINARDRWGRTPLHLAIDEEPLVLDADRLATVQLLIKSGADFHARDGDGDTPLHFAAFGEKEIVSLLLEQGADANAQDDAGDTALHKAVLYPEYEVARRLLRHGSRSYVRNKKNQTPLQVAEERGWSTLVELLTAPMGQ